MNPINLTDKEIARASTDGITVVTRPQPGGLVMVAIVSLKTCLPVFKPSFVLRGLVSETIAKDLRMLDTCGAGDQMARSSRDRNFCQG